MMSDHYYTPLPQSEHKPATVASSYRGQALSFVTDSGVFSRTEIDRGTEVLLNTLPQSLTGDVLDMGCGYGAIGVAVGKLSPACKITMADVNERACALAQVNATKNGVHASVLISDGYDKLMNNRFDTILQNPPIRAGKAVIYKMFTDAATCLNENGSLWLVIRKQQGAPSALDYLHTLYDKVAVVEKKLGYWIFCCEKPRHHELANTNEGK